MKPDSTTQRPQAQHPIYLAGVNDQVSGLPIVTGTVMYADGDRRLYRRGWTFASQLQSTSPAVYAAVVAKLI